MVWNLQKRNTDIQYGSSCHIWNFEQIQSANLPEPKLFGDVPQV
jgi:hypothetical protein